MNCRAMFDNYRQWLLTISRKETLISFSKAVNIFVLSSVTDITKLESADTVVVGSMISNMVGARFSSTSFACLIHLSPEMLADEIQCTLRISIKSDRIMYVLVTFSKEDTYNNNYYNNKYLKRVTPLVTGLVSKGPV